jgi:hypothetical protein
MRKTRKSRISTSSYPRLKATQTQWRLRHIKKLLRIC